MFNNVDIELTNGNLGQVASNTDGITGLIGSGTATGTLALNAGRAIFSLKDAEDLGITPTTHAALHRHISEFYAEKSKQELWLMICNPTTTMSNICDKNNNFAKKLVKDSDNRVRLLVITRDAGTGYTPTIENGLDKDCYDAIPKAQQLAEHFAGTDESSPVRVLIEAKHFNGNAGDLLSLKTMQNNRVGVVLMSSKSDGSSSVCLAAGRKSAHPVHRKISRTRSGALPITECYVGSAPVKTFAGLEMIHDKGFITARTFAKKSGYYFTSDHMATADTDDYSSLARGCVIDKAQIIAYSVFVEELDEEIDVDDNGQIAPGIIKTLEANIENAINIGMVGEISNFDAYIDANQNVLATNETEIELNVIPKGYNSNIKIKLGFKNPALNNA